MKSNSLHYFEILLFIFSKYTGKKIFTDISTLIYIQCTQGQEYNIKLFNMKLYSYGFAFHP